jgi:hypothetical protein
LHLLWRESFALPRNVRGVPVVPLEEGGHLCGRSSTLDEAVRV